MRGQQCAGTNTTNRIKLWPPPALTPAKEEAGTEGTVLTAARERKHVQRMSALALQVSHEIVARNGRYSGIDGRRLGWIQRLRSIWQAGAGRGRRKRRPERGG